MESNHEFYMRRCLELAGTALGDTYPNPVVGCVIVHAGKIIGEGFHRKAGEAHAEINALNSVSNPGLLPESTVYVSLEPCAHYGKTPPCALKLKEIGVKKVVIGTLDSFDKVNGKGKKILQDAGIDVISGVLEAECREINKRFFTFHQKNRPFIILKWAQSGDRFIDQNYRPYPISNALVNQYSHGMRAQEQAILVGSQTALRDNPSLTVRHISGKNPVRILCDSGLKVPGSSALFDDQAETIILNQIKNGTKDNIHYLKLPELSIANILNALYEKNIQSVIIEGGRALLQSFIDESLWDEAVIISNPNLHLERGTPAPQFDFSPAPTFSIRDNLVSFYLKDLTKKL